ncbi:MAG TPA: ASCH domain-containing protein [Candidatus Ozemobacteraceae bacterium]|nr:ASCH domain-containing protein [Candidatus Ozemobacteraceae bacterium]
MTFERSTESDSLPTSFTALSIVYPHGTSIARGTKTIEVRSWLPPQVPIRNLLIVENRVFLSETLQEDPDGRAVAIVDVIEVHPWRQDEVKSACSRGWQPGYFSWVLENVRPLPGMDIIPARRKLYSVLFPQGLHHL